MFFKWLLHYQVAPNLNLIVPSPVELARHVVTTVYSMDEQLLQ
jgi:hypothetical protein